MMSGSVNALLEATLELQIEGASGHLHTIEVVIDTGFTGDLTIPMAQIASLGLAWVGKVVGQLADGSQQQIDVYDGILMWDYAPARVKVQAVETEPLLGTRLLAGCELKAHFVPGGAVTCELVP